MQTRAPSDEGMGLGVPRSMLLLMSTYFAASLAHFSHNAQYIAFYPGMPAWLTPGKVWLFWFAVTGVGLAALAFARLGLLAIALLTLAVYGALGLDGLLHYTLGLCSQHTLIANLTIWAEAVTGLTLLLVSALLLARHVGARPALQMENAHEHHWT
ncbi:hypothetical protein [Roseateles sp. P5_E7]